MLVGSPDNIISNNDFFSNYYSAFIQYRGRCKWKNNYWGRIRFTPKILFGFSMGGYYIDVDWRPALKPNYPEGVEYI